MRGMMRLRVALAAVLTLTGISCAARATLSEGSAAPALKVATTDGKSVDMAGLRGKVVVLDFWATWCPPCKAEIPHLQALYRKYNKQGLRVLGVSLAEDREMPAQFARKNGLSYTIGWTTQAQGRALSRQFGVSGIPVTYIVDKRGIIRFAEVGFPTTTQEQKDQVARMDKLIKSLLAAR